MPADHFRRGHNSIGAFECVQLVSSMASIPHHDVVRTTQSGVFGR